MPRGVSAVKRSDALERLEALAADVRRRDGLDARVRVSASGVPHVVIEWGESSWSVAWFHKSRTFRVFWPYHHGGAQSRRDFARAEDVRQFIRDAVADRITL